MNRIIKRILTLFLVLAVIVIASPFFVIQFGPPAYAHGAKMLLSATIGYNIDGPDASVLKSKITVAENFEVSIYATGLEKVRALHLASNGDLLVSRPRSGDVILLKADRDGDGKPDGQETLLSGLVRPHGIDIYDGWLYVGESTGIGRVRFDDSTGSLNGDYQRIIDGLGDAGNHWTKAIAIGPDGYLYIASGSTCNVCEEEDPQRATMMRANSDGSDLKIYATGLRNSVGFDWAPWDGGLYATDNGRDLLGDDFPPCELNLVEEDGFYGWPYINGFGDLDPDLGEGKEALLESSILPSHGFRAHNAPLGMKFLRQSRAPGFEKSALVALHGSWNRSEMDGYKVVSLHWQADGSIVEKDFLSGFNSDDGVLGRPVDVTEGDDGTIYVSDDYSGSIYKINYRSGTSGEVKPNQLVTDTMSASSTEKRSNLSELYSSTELEELTDRGSELYQQYDCSQCHNPDRQSATQTIKSLDGIASRYSVDALSAFFTAPTPPMPRFPLDEADRKALAVYLYSY